MARNSIQIQIKTPHYKVNSIKLIVRKLYNFVMLMVLNFDFHLKIYKKNNYFLIFDNSTFLTKGAKKRVAQITRKLPFEAKPRLVNGDLGHSFVVSIVKI